MSDFVLRAGDTLPELKIRFTLGGKAYPLTPSATVVARVQNVSTGAVFNKNVTIVDRDIPSVSLRFDNDDLPAGPDPVKFRCWWIMSDGPDQLTFPNDGHDTILVYPAPPSVT